MSHASDRVHQGNRHQHRNRPSSRHRNRYHSPIGKSYSPKNYWPSSRERPPSSLNAWFTSLYCEGPGRFASLWNRRLTLSGPMPFLNPWRGNSLRRSSRSRLSPVLGNLRERDIQPLTSVLRSSSLQIGEFSESEPPSRPARPEMANFDGCEN